MDIVKALALGADMAGVAGPFLRAADSGTEAAHSLAQEFIDVLRLAMFALGCLDLTALKGTPRIERTLPSP